MLRAGPCQQLCPLRKAKRASPPSSPLQVPSEVLELPSFWEARS
jgi:hypothetical protein